MNTITSTFLFIFLLLFAAHEIHIDDYEGRWAGNITINEQEMGILVTFSYSDDELDGTIDIPQQQAYNLPVEVLTATEDSLVFQFQTGSGPAVFYGNKIDQIDRVEGTFEQLGSEFSFYIEKRSTANGRYSALPEKELMIPTSAGQVSGSLVLTDEPSPLIILISGSGSQGRDEDIAGFKVFAELAIQLYDRGFSTFRYDDRGVNNSTGETDATLQELSSDLSEVIEFLRDEYSEEFSSIVLLGHSQGGLVSSLATKETSVDGIIYMAVPFFRGDEIINQQIVVLSEENGLSEEVIQQNLEFQEDIYEVARSEGDWTNIEQDLWNRLEAQINMLPERQRTALGSMESFIQSQIDRQLSAAKSRWFKSLVEYEPSTMVSTLQIPQLALFGEKDMQVFAEKNHQKAEQIQQEGVLLESVTIPSANHLFQQANTGMPTEYGMLEREFTDGFIETISSWLDSLES